MDSHGVFEASSAPEPDIQEIVSRWAGESQQLLHALPAVLAKLEELKEEREALRNRLMDLEQENLTLRESRQNLAENFARLKDLMTGTHWMRPWPALLSGRGMSNPPLAPRWPNPRSLNRQCPTLRRRRGPPGPLSKALAPCLALRTTPSPRSVRSRTSHPRRHRPASQHATWHPRWRHRPRHQLRPHPLRPCPARP